MTKGAGLIGDLAGKGYVEMQKKRQSTPLYPELAGDERRSLRNNRDPAEDRIKVQKRKSRLLAEEND